MMKPTRCRELQTFYAEVLSTAVLSGSGIGVWAEIRAYRWFSTALDGGSDEPADDGADNAHAVIVERESAEAGLRQMTPDTVAHAFALLSKGPVTGLADAYRNRYLKAQRDRDAEVIDAWDADNIVQVGLFDEVVYG